MTLSAAVILTLLFITYLYAVRQWRRRAQGLPLPPGPRRLPVLGNMLNMPQMKPWKSYRDMSRQYGSNVVYFQVLGERVVVLNSVEAITDLLTGRRTVNTSDRTQSPLVRIAGFEWNFSLMPYGRRWREHRRVFWQYFHPSAIEKYQPAHSKTMHEFLRRLLDDPSRLKDHIRRTFCATMMKILYDNEDEEDVEMSGTMIEEMQVGLADCFTPGRYLAQMVPCIDLLPEWFLGPELRSKVERWRAVCQHMRNRPFEKAKQAMIKDDSHDSIVKTFLSRSTSDVGSYTEDDREELIKNVATIAFEGGADTIYSTLQSLFLAISLHPDVLRKAHAELDLIVGPHRLPNFGDRESLVYVNAIVKETFRWQNVAPLGTPHATIADDVFNGYFIPAGTIIVSNVWACMHDPQAYDNPGEFRPERFIKDGRLDSTTRDPYAVIFGAGRRICPGRHLADQSLFINVAAVLHVFDIGPPLDEQSGAIIEVKPEMTGGILSYPEDCRCTIKPRSAEAEALIRSFSS